MINNKVPENNDKISFSKEDIIKHFDEYLYEGTEVHPDDTLDELNMSHYIEWLYRRIYIW